MRKYDGYLYCVQEITGNAVYKYPIFMPPIEAVRLADDINRDFGAVFSCWVEHSNGRIADYDSIRDDAISMEADND